MVEKRHYLDSYLITYVGYCSHGRNFEVDSYDLNRQWIIREENGHDYTIIFAPKWLLYITHRHIQLLTYICKLLSSQFFSSTCTKWTSIVLAIATFNLQWYLSALIRTFFLRKKYFWWIFTRIEIMLYCNMRRNAWHSHMLDLVHWPKAVSKSLLNIFFLFFLYLFPLC